VLSVLSAVLPIFALILAGWLARRIGVMSSHAAGELNRFVVYLALPALLLDIVANARWDEIWQPGFIAAFGSGAGIVFAIIVTVRLRTQHLADATIDGLNAAYANTGFMGFPLALSVLGSSALAPTMVATILTVCMLFAVALILIEIGLQKERLPRHMAMKVTRSLIRNPLLIAPLLGATFMALGLQMPGPAERFLKVLESAASPCALVALGLFLAEKRPSATVSLGVTSSLVALKLLAQPAITWMLAMWAFRLTPNTTHLAVLLAALPTGTGPFMVAEFYRREAALTSRVVLFSTVVSLITITAYLAASR
jgi:malonate transporter